MPSSPFKQSVKFFAAKRILCSSGNVGSVLIKVFVAATAPGAQASTSARICASAASSPSASGTTTFEWMAGSDAGYQLVVFALSIGVSALVAEFVVRPVTGVVRNLVGLVSA